MAQAKLLDAFDPSEPSYMPVGGSRRLPTACRLISATNRDVFELASAGVLRQDLLSRLVVGQLTLPPLRARREDMMFMFMAALERAGVRQGLHELISLEVAEAMLLSRWVENVRGLQTLARRVALGEALTPELVQAHANRGVGMRGPGAPSAGATGPITPASPMRAVTAPQPATQRPVALPQAPSDPLAAAALWPPPYPDLLSLLARHQWSIKEAAGSMGKRRETLSRHMSGLLGRGAKERARRAWRVWQESGRLPPVEHVDALHQALFEAPGTPEARALREAWRAGQPL